MSAKRFTLVTSNFNSGTLLLDTVHSVLNQTLVLRNPESIQYIVLDAGSTDGSLEAALPLLDRDFVTILSKTDRGLYDGLANAYEGSTGELMGWINAGDFLYPAALETIDAVERDTGSKWMTGYNSFLNERGQVTRVTLPFRYRSALFECGLHGTQLPTLQQESTWWHRDLLADFDWPRFRDFRLAGDFFLWQHLSKQTVPDIVHTTIGGFRRHENQLSGDFAQYRSELAAVCRKSSFFEQIQASVDQVLWRTPDFCKHRLAASCHIRYSEVNHCWHRMRERA